MKVMIISPIRQNPEVLGLFLKSLSALAIQYRNQIEIAYYFADDNVERQSTALLYSFQKTMVQAPYQCDVFIARSESEHTDCVHDWTPQKILKMVHLRNGMIQAVRPMQWDFLLTIDSDIILHPDSLPEMLLEQKSIISPLHWTNIRKGYHPNVWLYDIWDFAYREYFGEHVSRVKKIYRMNLFFEKLAVPGVYQVGGACGCCCISRDCIEKGLDYSVIPSTTIISEDYNFCLRASVLGLDIYVDTRHPAFHLYEPEQMAGAVDFYKKWYGDTI